MVWLALLLQPLCLIQVKKQECGGKTIKDLFIFLKRTHVFQTGTVNMQGFVWKFLCAIYKFSFIHSFIKATQIPHKEQWSTIKKFFF